MIIGIISDTHGKNALLSAGLDALLATGAQCIIHCGDIGGYESLEVLAAHPLARLDHAGQAPAFVWGNCDPRSAQLERHAAVLRLNCGGDFVNLALGGKRLAVTHGDKPAIIQRVLTGKAHDYLLMGHTHVARDEVVEGVRIINPGAMYRSASPSVATLDTDRDIVRFIEVSA